MHDLHSLLVWPSGFFLALAAFLLLLGVYATLTGRASSRYRWVYRAKEPGMFWSLVAMYYLGGVCLAGYFLYKVYGLSN